MGRKKTSEAAPELLSTADAAKLLGLDPSMVRRYAQADLIPHEVVGKGYVFRWEVVAGWTPPRKPGRPKKASP